MTTPSAPQGLKATMKQDFDGLTMGQEEHLSVQRVTRANAAGKTQQELDKEWKQAVMQRLKDLNKQDEVNYLNSKNWLGDQKGADGNLLDPTGQGQPLDGKDAFGDLWQKGTPQWQAANPGASSDKIYQGYTWGTSPHNPSDSYLAGTMVGRKATDKTPGRNTLMHDTSFQTITSVQRKHTDGTVRSPDPLADNYAVGARRGDLVKVTYPDGSVHYMPTDDTNPGSDLHGGDTSNLGEISDHAMYGNKSGTSITMQPVGRLSNPAGGDHLSNDQWDEIGSNNYRNDDGTIPNTQKQLDAARAKAEKAKEDQAKADKAKQDKGKGKGKKSSDAGGGPKLLVGYATAMHGADDRCIGYADSASVHAAGGHMKEGSCTAFVGPEAFPISRVGDGTNDEKVAVTGADDFYVGGAPTSV